MNPRALAPLAFLAITPFSMSAATLADYSFTGGSTTSSASVEQATAGAFTKGSGTNSAVFTVHDLARIGTGHLAPSTAEASVTANAYYSFTVTAAEGYSLDLSALSFDAVFYGTETNVSVNYKGAYFVRSSLDNFANTLGTEAVRSYVYPGVGDPAPTLTGHSIDLSAPTFQSIAGSITFRIYLYDYNNTPGTGLTSGTRYVALDNVVLSGVISPIPEPSAFTLLAGGFGLLAAVSFRRQQR